MLSGSKRAVSPQQTAAERNIMFVDTARITVKAGNGGDGSVSFHREKFVAAGGPDGGDGGRGGNVVFKADDNLSTLLDFRYKRKYAAQNGADGQGSTKTGKSAEDLVIRVPRGTIVRDYDSGAIIADISGKEPVVIARGGRGGFGNVHFATPTRQIPRFAKAGLAGEQYELKLELKLIADVGLVGFPNVGKSTLLSVISAARPKIGNYHFTTLSPMLGVVSVAPERSFVVADIPGLIEGASKGVGLGFDFLRHVERCRMLVHVVDVSGSEGRDPVEDFIKINEELSSFSERLASLPQIVAGNKTDVSTEHEQELREFAEKQGYEYIPISAATGKNTDKLINAVWQKLWSLPAVQVFEPSYVKPKPPVGRSFTAEKTDEGFVVDAPWLETILKQTDVDDYESLMYFQRALSDSGILARLEELGIHENDTVFIGEYQFDYVP